MTSLPEIYIQDLSKWDKKTVSFLTAFYDAYYLKDPKLFEHLAEVVNRNVELDIAVSWLVKHHYDQKKYLSETLLDSFILHFVESPNWATHLHLCQTLSLAEIPDSKKALLYEYALKQVHHTKPFIRAWAFQLLAELSINDDSIKVELIDLCTEAYVKEKASVKARIRAIKKQLKF